MPAAHSACRSRPGGIREQKHSGRGWGLGAGDYRHCCALRPVNRSPSRPQPRAATTQSGCYLKRCPGQPLSINKAEQKTDRPSTQARGGIQDKAATWCLNPLNQAPGQTASLTQQENRPRPPQAPQDKDPPPRVCWTPPKPGGPPGGTFREPGRWDRDLLSDLHG